MCPEQLPCSPQDDLDGQVLVDTARSYVGVPYFHCGRNRNGLDCLGLLLCVAHDLGLTGYDCVDYSRQVDVVRFQNELDRYCDRRPHGSQPEPGDILLFRAVGTNEPQHVGIATERAGVIHCTEMFGKVVEHSLDQTWQRMLVRVYRWRNLSSEQSAQE